MKIVVIVFGCLLFTSVSAGKVIGQAGDVSLWPTLDGFGGEYLTENDKLLIEHRVANSELTTSRILNSSGQTIVEAVRVPSSLKIKVTGVTITFSLSLSNPEASAITELSEKDRLKMEEFSRSEASATIRYVLASIIRQKGRDGKDQLFGFAAIAMLLGDGPGAPRVSSSREQAVTVQSSYLPLIMAWNRLRLTPRFFQLVAS